MSDTFKYMNPSDKDDSNEQAAKSFLDDKLAKNRFTISQETELDQTGGKTVANASGEDDKDEPGGNDLFKAYKDKFGSNPMDDLKAVGSDTNAANSIYDNIRSLKDDSYWESANVNDLMAKSGQKTAAVIIGDDLDKGGLNVNASLTSGINFDDIQGQLEEKAKEFGWNLDDAKNNSISQLGRAMLAAEGGSDGKEAVEHSPEIKQAKARVKSYEDDIMSGKTSDDIYGNSKYNLDLTQGADGIGTPSNNASHGQAMKATNSFLEKKKYDLKMKTS